MKKRFAIILPIAITFGLIAAVSVAAQAQDFKVCKSKFALCTVAWCDPIPGNDKQVSCHCTVNTGYSAGQEPSDDQGNARRSAGQVTLFSSQELCDMLK
jgi:hypothetical protein